MSRPIRIVAPFKPFPPESELHVELRDFDWMDALRMVVASAEDRCQCPVHAVTDDETDLPVPALRYQTVESRLMLWTLEACCCYLESDDFDRDTIMLDVDQLVFQDLAHHFPESADLGLLMRPTAKHTGIGEPLLNGVQFWSFAAKVRLSRFYRDVLALARSLSEIDLQWGADTIALRRHVAPMTLGLRERHGVSVSFMNAQTILEAFSSEQMKCLREEGRLLGPTRPVLDFRWKRKTWMRPVYDVAFGARP